MLSLRSLHVRLSVASLLFSPWLLSACGGGAIPEGVSPIDGDYVLTVFELQSPSAEPCAALMGLPREPVDGGAWFVCSPVESELLSVMDCLGRNEEVLSESTGRIFGWEESGAGWDLFSKRLSPGEAVVGISGHGVLTLSLGERDGERILQTQMEVQHQSGRLSVDDTLRYMGELPSGASLLFFCFLSEESSAPQLCVLLELQ